MSNISGFPPPAFFQRRSSLHFGSRVLHLQAANDNSGQPGGPANKGDTCVISNSGNQCQEALQNELFNQLIPQEEDRTNIEVDAKLINLLESKYENLKLMLKACRFIKMEESGKAYVAPVIAAMFLFGGLLEDSKKEAITLLVEKEMPNLLHFNKMYQSNVEKNRFKNFYDGIVGRLVQEMTVVGSEYSNFTRTLLSLLRNSLFTEQAKAL